MNFTRRSLIKKTVFGAGTLGLKALATGLPAAFVSRPLAAVAQDFTCSDKSRAQYLIIATSSAGDPLNANVPGTYAFPDIAHSPDPRMAAANFTLGGVPVTAAQVWSTLPQWVLDRTAFFHHATLTNNHANLPKVMRLMGSTARQEMLPSILAKYLAPCFGTVQVDPVSAGAGDILTIDGRDLPNVAPTGLRDLLARPNTPLLRLQATRDQALDEIYTVLKDRGTKAQKLYLDSLVTSRKQARSLGSDLVDMLAGIKNDGSDGQVIAAVSLIKMNVTSVVTIRLNFGGDNHTDPDLARSEAPQHESGILAITQLQTQLQAAGLADQVTFAMYNVFGRTLRKNGVNGRDHWGSHHATVLMGKNIKAGVVGGLEPKNNDYYATTIDAKTGRSGGDIPFAETLSAMGKTLGAAVGLKPEVMDRYIAGGKVVQGALV
ncbi:MAG TPA: DUF1501 domain-containing protein [Polyangia bacterium]|nr:DUF1501 domain-containing protein [Polyangia bacterium]